MGANVVASQGSYDPGTGIWRIGELESVESRPFIGKGDAETLTIIAEAPTQRRLRLPSRAPRTIRSA